MTLLNIFHTGGLTLGLSLVWAFLFGVFGYQAVKAHKSGWWQYDPATGKKLEGNEKIPYTKLPQFWLAIAVTVAWVIALLFVASDYKGV